MAKLNKLSKPNLKMIAGTLLSLLLVALLQGCLSSTVTENGNGTLAGELPQIANTDLILLGSDSRISIKTDENGRFAASLAPGKYQLLMQSLGGELVVIKRTIQIENNLTFIVTDVDLIPIPKVVSVSVPLIYSSSAIIEWETDIESDGYVEYGSNELYGYSSYSDTELKTSHRIQIYDLLPGSTYHFRISASRYSLDSAKSYTRDYAFTTEP